MSASTIVHGPQGCGKTFHAAAICKALGLTSVVETEWLDLFRVPAEGILVLTHKSPPFQSDLPVLSFEQAMALTRPKAI